MKFWEQKTNKMTSVFNGNRFQYIAPLINKSPQRNFTCAACLYHYSQATNFPKP